MSSSADEVWYTTANFLEKTNYDPDLISKITDQALDSSKYTDKELEYSPYTLPGWLDAPLNKVLIVTSGSYLNANGFLPATALCSKLLIDMEKYAPNGVCIKRYCGFYPGMKVTAMALALLAQIISFGSLEAAETDAPFRLPNLRCITMRLCDQVRLVLQGQPVYCQIDAITALLRQYSDDPNTEHDIQVQDTLSLIKALGEVAGEAHNHPFKMLIIKCNAIDDPEDIREVLSDDNCEIIHLEVREPEA